MLLLRTDFDIVSFLQAWSIAHAFFPPVAASDSFHNKYIMLITTKKQISISDGCTLSVCIQAGHSLVYQLWGECSGRMINCYSSDYTNRPSMCLTPSPPHPQRMQNHFPLYSTYLSLCVPLSAHPPMCPIPLTHKPLHSDCLTDCCYFSPSLLYFYECPQKGNCQESHRERKKCAEGFGQNAANSIIV